MFYKKLQLMVTQNEPFVTTASYIRSIIAVTKPAKLSEVDTRVNTHLLQLPNICTATLGI